jgi:hypothetical protein
MAECWVPSAECFDQPCVKFRQGFFTLNAVALALVTNPPPSLFIERRQQIEGDIGGLKILRFGMANVMN